MSDNIGSLSNDIGALCDKAGWYAGELNIEACIFSIWYRYLMLYTMYFVFATFQFLLATSALLVTFDFFS
jgi:hypothetical protein